MADIEKVKQGLRCHSKSGKCSDSKNLCPYWDVYCIPATCADALSVIEELQAEIERLQNLLSDDQPCPPPPKGAEEQRWIPVSERLPDYTDTFLVWVGVNQVGEGMHMECRTAMFYYPRKTFYVHKEVQIEFLGDVVKWMPLPEPPQEVSQGG